MFIIKLEIEARQVVKWLLFTRNSVAILYDLVSFLEDAHAFLEPSFCVAKCFITKLAGNCELLVLVHFF